MNKTLFLLAAFGLILLAACTSDAELPPAERYEKDLAASLAGTERTDAVYLGIDLGITRKEYYDRCTELNKQQKIVMAGGSNAVDHPLKDELPREATMRLTPGFGEDRTTINTMTLTISYDDWAPWNKEAQASELIKDMYDFCIKTFGEGFYVVPDEKRGSVLVQFKNNRRIDVWVKDEREVEMLFTDTRG